MYVCETVSSLPLHVVDSCASTMKVWLLQIQRLKPGELNLEDKRQIVADLMVWSSIEASDEDTKR